MNYIYYSLFLGLLFTSSCTIEDQIERREDRLIGTWEIERAWFIRDFSLRRNYLTAEYGSDILTFFDNGELEYIEEDGRVYTGFWYLEAIRASNSDDETEFVLDADFYEVGGTDYFRWLGDISRLTYRNFNIRIADRDGELVLKWDKR